VDVEIQKTIEETPGGWDSTHLLGLAVACLWEYDSARMRVYGPDDVDALRTRLLKADRISGFNIFNFDFPVIFGVSKADWIGNKFLLETKARLLPKTDDMLRRIWQALGLDPDRFSDKHKGWGLDAVAKSTLRAGKIGYGGDAPRWFQEGQWARVANYCADDVALERDLTDFVERYGYVLNNGATLPLDPWKPAG
jgi:DEAD/DEAH box helicase domain-containing protein